MVQQVGAFRRMHDERALARRSSSAREFVGADVMSPYREERRIYWLISFRSVDETGRIIVGLKVCCHAAGKCNRN